MNNPQPILIPTDKIGKITKHYGLIKNVANDLPKGQDLVLEKDDYPNVPAKDWDVLRRMIQFELDSRRDNTQLYSNLKKLLYLYGAHQFTQKQVEDIWSSAYNFSDILQVTLGNRDRAPSQQDFVRSYTDFMNNNPQRAYDAIKAHDLLWFTLRYEDEPFFDIGRIEEIQPVADYFLLGDSQQGGKRKARKTRKVLKGRK